MPAGRRDLEAGASLIFRAADDGSGGSAESDIFEMAQGMALDFNRLELHAQMRSRA
jgi:hypothetical protein